MPGQSPDTILSLINEKDPIPRMDLPYLRTILWLAAAMPKVEQADERSLPVSGWLHALPGRFLAGSTAQIGFRVLQECPNEEFDDVCAVEVEESTMEKALALDFAQHTMARYQRNVTSWRLQDLQKLLDKRIRVPAQVETQGDYVEVNPFAELRIRGFEPWFASGDLGTFREWRISDVEPDGWTLISVGFDYPYSFQVAHLRASMRDKKLGKLYVKQYTGGGCDNSCELCGLFVSHAATAKLLEGDSVGIGIVENMGMRERNGCELSGFIIRFFRSRVRPRLLNFQL
jgi:hypothetical protein